MAAPDREGIGMRAIVMLATTFALAMGLEAPASAAPNCKKGKPCGNSCIAMNRTCHLDQAPREDERSRRPPEAPTTVQQLNPSGQPPAAPGVAPATVAPAATPRPVPPSPAPGAAGLWMASEADRVYFAPGCPAAADIGPANRRYFPDEGAAQAAGFRRSSIPGC
jgi:hypothetical protein